MEEVMLYKSACEYAKKIALIAALVYIFVGLATPRALAQAPNKPVPSNFFGMHLMQANNWPSMLVGSLGKGSGVTWPYVERSRGSFDWSRVDAFVNAASAH